MKSDSNGFRDSEGSQFEVSLPQLRPPRPGLRARGGVLSLRCEREAVPRHRGGHSRMLPRILPPGLGEGDARPGVAPRARFKPLLRGGAGTAGTASQHRDARRHHPHPVREQRCGGQRRCDEDRRPLHQEAQGALRLQRVPREDLRGLGGHRPEEVPGDVRAPDKREDLRILRVQRPGVREVPHRQGHRMPPGRRHPG